MSVLLKLTNVRARSAISAVFYAVGCTLYLLVQLPVDEGKVPRRFLCEERLHMNPQPVATTRRFFPESAAHLTAYPPLVSSDRVAQHRSRITPVSTRP